ncbi:hypothetical protein J416_09369 [Gracilibacillus halophilus YIM-C55.5]|uniref:Uncharacterized protein n=1 Tax=Gracilibacillus halophilus YIM-C55.5 TaxID=1308866 RepID=N4WUA7_9BACI|nr:hypothetical protein [Gracilibacillus halophilus]ENH96696.1 hypothetical protein J416_09369 [Gracilibacillus halophilus YIM-C55.5]
MHCPFCNREPKEIPAYKEKARKEEMSVDDYVRMDEGTYHMQTDMFCCEDCYFKRGLPLYTDLIQTYFTAREKVIPLERR